MTDYVFRVPSPNFTDRQRTSTAGDSATRIDQWLWPPQALFNTPSKKLGMNLVDEFYLRARAVNWVVRICITLQLPQLIIATSAAYIHRFYMRKPLQKYSPKVMSATALFLATKVEEVPRKLEYVVREYLKIDEDGNEQSGSILEDSNEFQDLKQQILYHEDILLRTLCFDLAVDHPYVQLVNKSKAIHELHSSSRTPNSSISVELADRSKAKSITQAAWGFINDSLMTPLCLVATPELIAAAAFLLAVSHRLSECPSSDGNHSYTNNGSNSINWDHYLNLPAHEGTDVNYVSEAWWKVFDIESVEKVYEVANAMLDQYDLSVCDYIREKAGKLARFPGPSLLCPAVQILNTESTDAPEHEKASGQDVNNSYNNEDPDMAMPKIIEHDELNYQDMASASSKIKPDIPSANISKHEESHSPKVRTTPHKIDDIVLSVSLSREELYSEEYKKNSHVPMNQGQEACVEDVRSHREDSTPAKHAMSDNMDLGTSVDSDHSSSKSNTASPLQLNQSQPSLDTRLQTTTAIKKRSRSRGNSDSNDHPPKTPKLESIPSDLIEAHDFHLSTLDTTFKQSTLDQSSSLAKHHTDQQVIKKVDQNLSAHESESSLSDMEDGEVD